MLLLACGLILFIDGILNYPIRLQGNNGVPWAFVTVPTILIYTFLNDRARALAFTAGLGACATLCCALAVAFLPTDELAYVQQLPLCISAFAIGVAIAQSKIAFRRFLPVVVLALTIHALVAILFMLDLLPIIPGELARFSAGGVVYERPAFTTDQNYQVLYWTLAPALFVVGGWRTKLFALITTAVFLLALLQLGSRSGLLAFIGAIILSTISTVRNKPRLQTNSAQALGVIALLFVGTVFLLSPAASQYSAAFGERLRILEYRSATLEGQSTIGQRLESIEYGIDMLLTSPLPRGLSEFTQTSGTVPHSAPTTMLLLFGWVGLFVWLRWQAWPFIHGITKVFERNRVDFERSLYIGLAAAVIAYVTLPLPFNKVVWLLAGLCCFRLTRRTSPSDLIPLH